MRNELNMCVSLVCVKEGKQYAYVSFTDGERMAEGRIPDCRIEKNSGFEPYEIEQLERYMKRELTKLKKMAAEIKLIHRL